MLLCRFTERVRNKAENLKATRSHRRKTSKSHGAGVLGWLDPRRKNYSLCRSIVCAGNDNGGMLASNIAECRQENWRTVPILHKAPLMATKWWITTIVLSITALCKIAARQFPWRHIAPRYCLQAYCTAVAISRECSPAAFAHGYCVTLPPYNYAHASKTKGKILHTFGATFGAIRITPALSCTRPKSMQNLRAIGVVLYLRIFGNV